MSESLVDQRVKRGVAQLLCGIDTDVFDNGTAEPWRSVGQRLQSVPIPDRETVLKSELSKIEGVLWEEFRVELSAIDLNGPDPALNESTVAPHALPPAPPFPVDVLPRAFGDYVRESAASLCCPPEFVALPQLVCAGAAIGTSVRLLIKSDWPVWPLLYAVVVGPSGSKKTPAKNMATRFTYDKGAEYAASHAQNLANYEQSMAEYQRLVDERRRSKNKSELPQSPDKPRRPVLPRSWLSDSTMEAVGQRLKENPRGMVLLRDELAGLILSMNQYRSGRGADLQCILSIWSCDPVTIDRKNEPDPIVLHQPFLAVTGGIQPGLLPKVIGGDRLYDGFTARFLVAHPEVMPSQTSDAAVSEVTREAARATFENLFRIVASNPYSEVPEPQAVHLTREARTLMNDWSGDIGLQTDTLAEDDPFRAVLAKMPGQLGRLALILHCIRWASGEVDGFHELTVDTMRSGICLADYFVAHARRVWAQLTETREDSQVRRVLSWMRAQNRPVTKREIQRAGVAGFKNAMQVDAMVRYLVECELIEPKLVGRAERYGLRKLEQR